MQRGVLYGFISGSATAVLIVLLATVLNVPPGPIAIVLALGAILVLSLLLGASGSGTASAADDAQANHDEGLEGNIITPAENGDFPMNPSISVIVPSSKLEQVTYFLGFGIAAAVLSAIFLS